MLYTSAHHHRVVIFELCVRWYYCSSSEIPSGIPLLHIDPSFILFIYYHVLYNPSRCTFEVFFYHLVLTNFFFVTVVVFTAWFNVMPPVGLSPFIFLACGPTSFGHTVSVESNIFVDSGLSLLLSYSLWLIQVRFRLFQCNIFFHFSNHEIHCQLIFCKYSYVLRWDLFPFLLQVDDMDLYFMYLSSLPFVVLVQFRIPLQLCFKPVSNLSRSVWFFPSNH